MKYLLIILLLFSACVKIGDKQDCTPEQKKADVCIASYEPVCGWFSQDIKCIKYPCANTYSNSCNACKDEKVSYFTKGECPK